MTAEAAAIPGYCAEWRFDDTDSGAWDSGNERFNDLAGYGLRNAMLKTAGTPVFAAAGSNSRRGLKLDNSHNWRSFFPIGWQGTIGVLCVPTMPNNTTLNVCTNGLAASVSSNGRPFFLVKSGAITARCNAPSSSFSAQQTVTNNAVLAFVASANQEDRNGRSTLDAVTVTSVTATASSTNGNAVALGFAGGGSPVDTSRGWMRMGNNSGTIGDLTANATDYVTMFEIVMWKGDRLSSHLSAVKTWLDARRAYYGT